MTDAILGDLVKLAKSRCRDDIKSVIQLTDSDTERAIIIIAVVRDLILGASVTSGISETEIVKLIAGKMESTNGR